jgi:hypothetical protein
MLDLLAYQALVTSEHRDKPNFMATVAANLQPYVDMQVITLFMPLRYDLDNAVGTQLDAVGLWVGASRYVDLTPIPAPAVYFSFDTPGFGFDQAPWDSGPPPVPVIVSPQLVNILDDIPYRVLLRARIVNNHWTGAVEQAYAIWRLLFTGTDYSIQLQDNQNMTMGMTLVTPAPGPSAVVAALFAAGYLDIKPVGVTMIRRTLIVT